MDDLEEFFPRLEPEEDPFSSDFFVPQSVAYSCPQGFDIEVKQHDDLGVTFILTNQYTHGQIIGEVHPAYDDELECDYVYTFIKIIGELHGDELGNFEAGLEYCKELLAEERKKRE